MKTKILNILHYSLYLIILASIIYAGYKLYIGEQNNKEFALVVGFLMTLAAGIKIIIPKLEKKIEQENKICPYQPEKFYNTMQKITKNTILKLKISYMEQHNKELTPSVLTEIINNTKYYLPVIMLSKGEIKINEYFSKKKDTHSIDNDFINFLKSQCSKIIINNPTYRLIDILEDNTLSIGKSTYEQTLTTCDKHFYNFIDINKNLINEVGIDFQEWYSKLYDIVINKNLPTISASLGCSTLVIMKNFEKNKYEYLMMDNSEKKNGNNSTHVIPSFMFQPPKNTLSDDENFKYMASIKLQMFKEFAEEILGKNEFELMQNTQELILAIKNNEILQKLDYLLNNNQATFKTLGLSLDIFRLRPEILSVLIIENQDFYNSIVQNFIEQSQDNNHEGAFNNFEVDSIKYYDLMDEESYFNILSNKINPIVPPGAACLKLGRDFMINQYLKK